MRFTGTALNKSLPGGVVLHNSAAADKLTSLSENGGLNFWIGHCDVRKVTTVDPAQNVAFSFANPVWLHLDREGSYNFVGRAVWDQVFFSTAWAWSASGEASSATSASWPAACWT